MYTLGSSRTGGGILWAATEVVTLGAFVPIYLQWMHAEQRVAVRSDARGGGSLSLVGVGSADSRSQDGRESAAQRGHEGAVRLNGVDEISASDRELGGQRGRSRADSVRPGVSGLPPGSLSPASIAARAAAAAGRGATNSGLDVPISQLTAWEYAWLARTGNVPSRFVVPDYAPDADGGAEGSTD
jgi:hypothetical protein